MRVAQAHEFKTETPIYLKSNLAVPIKHGRLHLFSKDLRASSVPGAVPELIKSPAAFSGLTNTVLEIPSSCRWCDRVRLICWVLVDGAMSGNHFCYCSFLVRCSQGTSNGFRSSVPGTGIKNKHTAHPVTYRKHWQLTKPTLQPWLRNHNGRHSTAARDQILTCLPSKSSYHLWGSSQCLAPGGHSFSDYIIISYTLRFSLFNSLWNYLDFR
uniref:uncharacterized protein LOC118525347 n=1 Tax=Halichoerus grypus TaxID=9711 RepID=UPI00165996BC|nr:uncharacterized protein LOC118525347 [Halichoerus grypus]